MICTCQGAPTSFNTLSEMLQSHRLFQGLSPEQLEAIESRFVLGKTPRNQLLLQDGTGPARLHLLLSGQLKSVRYLEDGREVVLQMICPGKLFALTETILGGNYAASAWTLRPGIYASMSREVLSELMERIPVLSLRLMEMIAQQNENLLQRIEVQTAHSPQQRLVHFLIGESRARKTLQWRLPLPKAELARMLGTVPETLSRCFSDLVQHEVLSLQGREITIRDLDQLSAMCPNG